MFNKLLTYVFFLLFLNSIIAQNYDEQIINKKVDSISSLLKDKKLSPEERIDNLGVLADAYLKKNDLDNSLKTILNIKKLAIEIKDTFSLARAYKGFAIISSINANSKKEIKDLKKAIMLFKSLKNHAKKNEYLRASYYHIANTYVVNNNYGEANKAILNAYDYIPKDNEGNSKYLKIDLLNLQGYINSEIENNSEALINLKEALVLETEINDDYGKANTYNAIAIIHSKQKNETKALNYYQLALDIFEKLEDISLKGMSYNNIGISYYELKNYTKAEDLLLKSIEISKEINNKSQQSDSYLYLGKCNIAKDNIDLGLQNISKSLQLALEVNSPSLIIDNLLVKAEVANKYNNTTQAIAYLNESLLYTEKSETIDLKKRVYRELTNVYENVNSKKHEFYNKKYTEIKDSIQRIQQINKTEVLKAEFDNLKTKADLKSKEIGLLLAKEREEASKTRLILLAALASIFILALMVTILRQVKLNKTQKEMWSTKKDLMALKQENTEKEIEFKNKQITDFAIHISEKNDLLEDIKQKIKKLPIVNKTIATQINNVIVFINDDINQNKEKIQLYSEINETTNSFNHNLTNRYPNLTEKERRIATLVRLSHTSKQISLQLNITPASVDNYRSILRKKMNVPKGASIVKFIKNI
ncbi:MAG: hypothetical protein COA88_11870 [Kordia sp.]|nr:MAG: hypothetical protein COA88_11870 [Kordia sp.]